MCTAQVEAVVGGEPVEAVLADWAALKRARDIVRADPKALLVTIEECVAALRPRVAR